MTTPCLSITTTWWRRWPRFHHLPDLRAALVRLAELTGPRRIPRHRRLCAQLDNRRLRRGCSPRRLESTQAGLWRPEDNLAGGFPASGKSCHLISGQSCSTEEGLTDGTGEFCCLIGDCVGSRFIPTPPTSVHVPVEPLQIGARRFAKPVRVFEDGTIDPPHCLLNAISREGVRSRGLDRDVRYGKSPPAGDRKRFVLVIDRVTFKVPSDSLANDRGGVVAE